MLWILVIVKEAMLHNYNYRNITTDEQYYVLIIKSIYFLLAAWFILHKQFQFD